MAECNTPAINFKDDCRYNKCLIGIEKELIYYPSNSKKGLAIKGTNLRVGFRTVYKYQING